MSDKREIDNPRAASVKELLPVVATLLLGLVAGNTLLPAQAPIQFVDRSRESGLNIPIVYGGVESQRYILETTGTGAATFDYDRDGRIDIFLVNGSRLDGASSDPPSNVLYRNLGNGRFSDVTAPSGLKRSGWGQAVCVGDIDNDGWTDLAVTYYGEIVLYRNRGNGSFEDISQSSRIGGQQRWNAGCTFLDYDRDADLDLFVANYVDYADATRYEPGSGANCMWRGIAVMCGPLGLKQSANIMFRNNGDGTFSDVSPASGITRAEGFYCLMPITLDFDEDGWTDIYVACDTTPNILYRNNRDGTFEDVAMISGVALSDNGREQAGMGVAAADYDLDGHLDLLVTNFSDDTSTLYRNDGNSTFTDTTYLAKLGKDTQYLSWGTGLVDFDNDGWKDLFIASGHVYPEADRHPSEITYRQQRLVYRNQGDGSFRNASSQAGDAIAAKSAGRGVAFEDLDGDGDLDIVAINLNDTPSLLVNESASENNWLILELEGEGSNRSAIGARIQVAAGGRIQTDEVRSASSYYSSNGLRVHFGLGKESRAEWIEIRWPSGSRQRFEDVQAGRVISVREGTGIR